MGGFLAYSLASGLILAGLYLTYRVFLSGDKMHNYNRCILLSIYIVSFGIMPGISLFQSLRPISNTTVLHTVNINVEHIMTPIAQPVWGTVLIWVFIAGMGITAYRTAITWSRLLKTIRNGEKIIKNGYTLVLTDNEKFAPFSWMKYIVISHTDYKENGYAITTHELRHIECHHWIDLLIAQAAAIINWFNPAIWLMRDELTLIHEYQADMAVIDNGTNLNDYQMLLIKKAVGSRFPSLANSLNHSKLKKRITMMYKEKPSKGRRLKALTLVPMLALALTVTAVPSVRAAISTISSSRLSVSKDNKNPADRQTTKMTSKITSVKQDSGNVTISLQMNDTPRSLHIADVTLNIADKKYKSSNTNVNISNNTGTAQLIFKDIPNFNKGILEMTINGTKMSINLNTSSKEGSQNETAVSIPVTATPSSIYNITTKKGPSSSYSSHSFTVTNTVTNDSVTNLIVVSNDSKPMTVTIDKSLAEDGKIYVLNGKQVTKADIDAIVSEDITSDSKNNIIIVMTE